MSWHRIQIRSDQAAIGTNTAITMAVGDACLRAGRPADAAMFSQVAAGEEFMVNFFLSPAAAALVPELLRQYGAVPSAPPVPPAPEYVSQHPVQALSLVVGADTAWKLLSRQ